MARRLTLLFAALLAALALAPSAASADAQNRVGASLSAAPTHTGAIAAESACTHPASAAGQARIAQGCCVAAKAADHAIPIGPAPQNAAKVLDRVLDKGAPFPGYKGGGQFDNVGTGMRLPETGPSGPIKYREWDVNPNVKGVDRGPERLVTGSDGSAYSTRDHYGTFVRIR